MAKELYFMTLKSDVKLQEKLVENGKRFGK